MENKCLPLDACVKGRVYYISSRNLSLGVFDGRDGFIGIREKLGSRYLFTEHYHTVPYFGTVWPLGEVATVPDGIEINTSLTHEHGRDWLYRNNGVYIPTIRHWFKPGESYVPHGTRVGFEDVYADSGKRIPDKCYPLSRHNTPLFRYLEELGASITDFEVYRQC